MRGGLALVVSAAFAVLCHSAVAEQVQPAGLERIQLKVDTSEAVLDAKKSGASVDEQAWQRIFSSEPYVRLKKREASFHREFTDDDFKKFALSDELGKREPALRRTLDAWAKEDLVAAARRVLPYLPDEAVIRAKVYLVIKPQPNSPGRTSFSPGSEPWRFRPAADPRSCHSSSRGMSTGCSTAQAIALGIASAARPFQ